MFPTLPARACALYPTVSLVRGPGARECPGLHQPSRGSACGAQVWPCGRCAGPSQVGAGRNSEQRGPPRRGTLKATRWVHNQGAQKDAVEVSCSGHGGDGAGARGGGNRYLQDGDRRGIVPGLGRALAGACPKGGVFNRGGRGPAQALPSRGACPFRGVFSGGVFRQGGCPFRGRVPYRALSLPGACPWGRVIGGVSRKGWGLLRSGARPGPGVPDGNARA